jgi:hypothetical protein
MKNRVPAIVLGLLASGYSGCGPSFYRLWISGDNYRNFGQVGDRNGFDEKDPVTQERYCSFLGQQATHKSSMQSGLGYLTTFVALGLVSTGAIWAATDTDTNAEGSKQRRRAVLAFPLAAVPLIPVSTFLFNRARNNAQLAAETAEGLKSISSGEGCNRALETWYARRTTDLSLFGSATLATVTKEHTSNPQELVAELNRVATETQMTAERSKGSATTNAKDDLAATNSRVDSRIAELKPQLETLRPELKSILSATIKDIERKVETTKATLGVPSTKPPEAQSLPDPDAGTTTGDVAPDGSMAP